MMRQSIGISYPFGAGFRAFFYGCLCYLLLAVSLADIVKAEIYEDESLIIVTNDRELEFRIELADTDAKRAVGLMNRESMPEDAGMLFCFGSIRPVYMWMKDTILPLDMLFIRPDGTISSIVENTTPFSTEVIASEEPVLFVLELNAGTVSKLGIKNENRVKHSSILSCT